MSFRTTRDVLESFRDAYARASRWCSRLDTLETDPEFVAAVSMVKDELTARALSFEAAIDDAESKALGTFLQYEPTESLRQAVKDLTCTEPHDAESLLAAVDDFYQVAFVGMNECEEAAESTPAEPLFTEMEREAQAGIAALAWKVRPEI